jgi:hypothetical protein
MDALEYASAMWPSWFGHPPPDRLREVILTGGPAHKPRAIVFVLPPRDRKPAVIVKVAFTPGEAAFLHDEFRALSDVHGAVPPHLREGIPAPLGLYRAEEPRAMVATSAVAGRRLLVPDLGGRGGVMPSRMLRSFLRGTFAWSRELAEATQRRDERDEQELAERVDRFLTVYRARGSALRPIRSFGRAVGRARIRWRPAWQHRDVSVGNALVHRGAVRFVDWEHADGASEPWYDIAYAPPATALLAQRQRGIASVQEAAKSGLGADTWVGRLVRREMELAWSHPLPLGWAVALTALSTALRRERSGRVGWSDWAEFAMSILADTDFRRRLEWLAPEW